MDDIDIDELIVKTAIINTIGRILGACAEEEEIYYMKLEAFWILTQLCITKDDEKLKLFVGQADLSLIEGVHYDLKKSILSLID